MSDKNPKEQSVQTAIRFPKSFLDRADKLAAQMTQPGLHLMRADVIRMAAFTGIEQFEAQQKSKKR